MAMPTAIKIVAVDDAASMVLVRQLLGEYAAWLEVDLCFQDFANELAGLPGKYAPPSGSILLAYLGTQLAGCIAVRALEPEICEMKRLWVREEFRGHGVGAQLVDSLIDRARDLGYRHMRLDSLPKMQQAIALYRSRGFYEIPAYYPNPLAGTIYMEKNLSMDLT